MDLWSFVTLAAVFVTCLVGIIAAVRVVVRAVRTRNSPPSGLARAGAAAGTADPAVAFDRAEGKMAWTRIGGGGF